MGQREPSPNSQSNTCQVSAGIGGVQRARPGPHLGWVWGSDAPKWVGLGGWQSGEKSRQRDKHRTRSWVGRELVWEEWEELCVRSPEQGGGGPGGDGGHVKTGHHKNNRKPSLPMEGKCKDVRHLHISYLPTPSSYHCSAFGF